MDVIALPALNDNYIWLLTSDDGHAVVVDPGAAEPVLGALAQGNLVLDAVLITHHHGDHVAGLGTLLERQPHLPVYGPARENVAGVTHAVGEGDQVVLDTLGLTLQVLDTPGHTAGHISFAGPQVLFCGDTLFAAGCGRLLEGSAEQMHPSLAKLKSLPGDTRVYCGHEYTQSNVAFALKVEPDNADLKARAQEVDALRSAQRPTLPTTIDLERRTNPFLRWDQPQVIRAAEARVGHPLDGPAQVFAVLRQWKDNA